MASGAPYETSQPGEKAFDEGLQGRRIDQQAPRETTSPTPRSSKWTCSGSVMSSPVNGRFFGYANQQLAVMVAGEQRLSESSAPSSPSST